MKILDKNISEQTRGIFRKEGDPPAHNASAREPNEWRDIPREKGSAQVLSDEEILELSELVVEIEQHYGFPVDIEWARADGKFYIVQSRPITTLTHIGSVDKKIEFQKTYSRDTTLFTQGLWAQGLNERAKVKFGWVNPHTPYVAHFVNDGVIEIWEHKQAIQWFLDKLLEENKLGTKFLNRLLTEYKTLLTALSNLHAKEYLSSSKEVHEYRDLVYNAAFAMTIFFYTGIDERSPQQAQKIAILAREEGSFFTDNDMFVRKNIAHNAHISNKLAGVVLSEEYENVPETAILENRLKASLFIDGILIGTGNLDQLMKDHPIYQFKSEMYHLANDTFKGQIAFFGKVSGLVRIVKKQEDCLLVHAGDILISPMTTPDFLPAMKLANAFVTDEGGITCHAAIVSRELKKPCIIGTKIATQVLKDGDLVEVDADQGVVRVLKQREEPKYLFLWSNYQALFTIDNYLNAYEKYRHIDWNESNNIIAVVRDNTIRTFHSLADVADDIERGKKLLEDAYFDTFVVGVESARARFLDLYSEIRGKDVPALSNEKLLNYYLRMADRWMEIMSYFHATQAEGSTHLEQTLTSMVGAEKARILMVPHDLDIAQKEMLDWHKLISSSSTDNDLLNHAYKYPWIVAAHFTITDVQDTLRHRYEYDKAHPRTIHIKAEKRVLVENQEQILNEYPNAGPVAIKIQRLVLSRMEIKSAFAGNDLYLIPILEEIAKRSGENPVDLNLYYRVTDVQRLMETGHRLSDEEKRRRKRCFVAFLKDGKPHFYSGDEAEKIAREELGQILDVPPSGTLTGVSTNPGKIRARARILQSNNVRQNRELRESFTQGEILVTAMTQPNIIDIASRAGAIVTDEGSTLSHAAIISREFGIPCIVGTHTATQVIRDGDMVEVDANKGVVRIIKTII